MIKSRLFSGWWRIYKTNKLKIPGKKIRLAGLCRYRLRRIDIDSSLNEREELETLIHEILHVYDETKTEEWITDTSFGITKILWGLGWRKR